MNPSVSIIILNWNGINFTEDCIKSIRKKTSYKPYEIIVVDNGSEKKEVEKLKEMHKKKLIDKLILNKSNEGFSGGNNQGMEIAKGSYMMLLNNDILVKKNWLSKLVKVGEEHEKIGLIGPKITLNHTPNTCFGAGKITDSGAAKFGYETTRQDVEQIGGAALLFKRAVFEEIGGLDNGFNPIYFEESDFCTRAIRAGYRVVFVPESEVIHFENAAVSKQPGKEIFVTLNKNRLRYMLIHFSKFRLLKATPIEVMRFAKGITMLRHHWLLKAYAINIKDIGEITNKRQRYKKGNLKPQPNAAKQENLKSEVLK